MIRISSSNKYALGRKYCPDPRDTQYPLKLITKVQLTFWQRLFKSRTWKTIKVFDQGSTPECVGYSWEGWLWADPIETTNGPSPDDIYIQAQAIDEWAGTPHDGTSVRAAAKVLDALGHIAGYYWAAGADDVRNFVLTTGTVIIGSSWYDDMFTPDDKGYLNIGGAIAGGHAWHVIGYSFWRRAFRMQNSWGSAWGEHGQAWVRFKDLDRLIQEQGEGCAAKENSGV